MVVQLLETIAYYLDKSESNSAMIKMIMDMFIEADSNCERIYQQLQNGTDAMALLLQVIASEADKTGRLFKKRYEK